MCGAVRSRSGWSSLIRIVHRLQFWLVLCCVCVRLVVTSAPAGALEFLAEPGRQRLSQPVEQVQQLHVVLMVILSQEGTGLGRWEQARTRTHTTHRGRERENSKMSNLWNDEQQLNMQIYSTVCHFLEQLDPVVFKATGNDAYFCGTLIYIWCCTAVLSKVGAAAPPLCLRNRPRYCNMHSFLFWIWYIWITFHLTEKESWHSLNYIFTFF